MDARQISPQDEGEVLGIGVGVGWLRVKRKGTKRTDLKAKHCILSCIQSTFAPLLLASL